MSDELHITAQSEPYYQDDLATIYHGDCRDFETCPAVLITDPPYGFDAYASDQDVGGLTLAAFVRAAPCAAIFGYPETLVVWCVEGGLRPTEWVTWWPTNKPSARTTLLPREVECVAVFGDPPGAGRLFRPRSADAMTRRIHVARGNDPESCRLGDVWREASPGIGFNGHLRLHPNEKPVAVMRRLVELCSNPGDLILDPFMGSGTTLRAAKDLGRRAVGIEIEERYCEIAARRCAQEVLDVA